MRSAFGLVTVVAAVLMDVRCAVAQEPAQQVSEYVRLKACAASLYGAELGKWSAAFGTSERASREAALKILAKLIDYPMAESIGKARSLRDAQDAYLVDSEGAAFAFMLRRTPYVLQAYKLGRYVGQTRAMLAVPKIRTTEIQTLVVTTSDNIDATARALNLDSSVRGELTLHLTVLRLARNRADLEAASERLLAWHELFLWRLTPRARPEYDLLKALIAGTRRADFKALQWGIHAGSQRLRNREQSLEDLRISRDAMSYFGLSALPEELPLLDSDILPEQTAYYYLGASASRLLALRGLASDERLKNPVQSNDLELVSSLLGSLKTSALKLSLPEQIVAPIEQAEAAIKTGAKYGDVLQVLEYAIARWYGALSVHLGAVTVPNAEPVPRDDPAAVAVPSSASTRVDEETDNLEFMSGEITAIDEAAKTITVKPYQNTEDGAAELLTVSVDGATDITDGEQDRTLASLAAGTEVDVEYDSPTKRATYIFVY